MDIVEIVKRCGVVGAGGAGFPTHVKLDTEVDTVIVNGAECEPLLAGDKYLMEKAADRVVGGLEYIIKATSAKRGFVALKKKYLRSFQMMEQAVSGKKNIDVFPIDDFYPAGDEQVLVYEVTGRMVPENGLPPDVGCIVDNVETVINIYEAVSRKKPVIKRLLTCTGEVRNPSIVEAPIGTRISEVIETCGGVTEPDYSVVVGGPMMGIIQTDPEAPITKTTGGIIVLPEGHELLKKKGLAVEVIVKRSKAACCQCTYCTELCPRYMLGHDFRPHMIMRNIGYGIDVPAGVIEAAFLCSECGLCEVYACPMGLSPRIVNSVIKKRLLEKNYKPDFQAGKLRVHEMRNYRKIPNSRIAERLHINEYYSGGLTGKVDAKPDRVEILLRQHIGEPSIPVVKVGERVDEGSLIAEIPDGKLGATIHSSIGGRVIFIDRERIIIEK